MGMSRTTPEKEKITEFLISHMHVFYDGTLTYEQALYADMYYLGGATLGEVADEFEVMTATVSRTIKRAREKIFAMMGE